MLNRCILSHALETNTQKKTEVAGVGRKEL